MSTFPKYPEIALLPRRLEIMAVKEVIATEKLHGSTFRIHFPAGMASISDVKYGSHEVDFVPGEFFPLNKAVQWFQAKPELLTAMWEVIKSYGFPDATVFGEAYGPGMKSKGVKYSNGSEMLYRAFDIMIGENFVTYDLFVELADKMGLPRVHEVWRGEPCHPAFEALVERPSMEAHHNGIDDPANLAEGVVIRSNPLFRNVFGEWLIVKCKSKRFTEVAHAPAAPKSKEATPSDTFAATYVTEGRVTNAIGRLHDRGVTLKNDMTDMPTMLTEIIADLHKECEADWPAGVTDKQMGSAVSKVLSPIYRRIVTGAQ